MCKDRRPLKTVPQKQSIPKQPLDSKALDEFKKKYQHDAFCKNKLQNVRKARKFLKYLFKPEVLEQLDLKRLQIEPESYVDENLKRYYTDVLYRIPLKNSNESIVVFVLIELKTDNSRWTIFQMLLYIVRIWKRAFETVANAANAQNATEEAKQQFETFLLPMVIPIIFHHGEEKFTAPIELAKLIRLVMGMEEFALNLKAMLFDVTPLAPKDFPEDLELSAFFMLLQAVFYKEGVAEKLLEIYRKLRPTMHLAESQKEWQDAVYYATTSAKHFLPEDFKNVIKQTEKEGVVTMSTSVLDQLIAEAAEGKTKAVKAWQNAVLATLRKKFTNIPEHIETAIRQMSDPIALESLHSYALDSQTLDEFADALK
ncbi:MAG: Rpn family recombination-promoting nuclease/putative transposase [Planctomycetaceae bacterium]|jgi:hypothetical protein|nr:Rpn family recombination-promoting nuclease/putative transposase [Planctomycetaceae bacterium]